MLVVVHVLLGETIEVAEVLMVIILIIIKEARLMIFLWVRVSFIVCSVALKVVIDVQIGEVLMKVPTTREIRIAIVAVGVASAKGSVLGIVS